MHARHGADARGPGGAAGRPGHRSAFAAVALGLALVWALLAGGAGGSWLIGLPAIALATAWSVRHRVEPRVRPRPVAFARFLPYFLRESLRGGIDVARLALGRRGALRPGFAGFRMRLSDGPARRAFVTTVSLLPGTLSACIDGDTLLVHRVRGAPPGDADLRACEDRVAELFETAPDDGSVPAGEARDG